MRRSRPAIYMNDKQLSMVANPAPTKVWIGGRGTGKSFCIGASTYSKISSLPRSKGFFSSSTYHQILTKTLPAVQNMWNSIGLRPYVDKQNPGHYIVGRQPPKQWVRPLDRPESFKNVISFFNGACIEMLSMDRPDLARGGSYDYGEIDEATMVNQEHLTTVLIPSIRANSHRYNHWSHHQLSLYTSMPWKASGLYLLDYKDKAEIDPDMYFYQESTTMDNIKVLGDTYMERMKRELPYSTYKVEILNHRSVRGEHNFYYAFRDEVHLYIPKYNYDENVYGIQSLGSSSRDKKKPIYASFDMSGWFKGCTVYQEKQNVEYMIGAFSVPSNKGVRDLVDKMCDDYKDHTMKHVEVYGEPRGHNRSAEVGMTSYQLIEKAFNDRGWSCTINVQNTQVWTHDKRYDFINEILQETNSNLPKLRVDQDRCKDVVISINNTDVGPDFKKVKKDEKNRSFNQNHATHYTDTIDYYFEQKYSWRVLINNRGSYIGGVAM